MTAAIETVDGLSQNAIDLAETLRWGSALPARRKLRAVTETADTLVVLATRIGLQMGTTLAEVALRSTEVDEAITDLANAIDQLDMYQQDEDWSAVADTLDQEMSAALTAWRGVFNLLATTAAFRNPGACVA